MTKFKLIAGASMIMSAIFMSSVALAATDAMTSTTSSTPETTVGAKMMDKKVSPKMTTEQKACVKTAKMTKVEVLKTASASLAQALKDAKVMTDKVAAKTAKTAARKAYKDAVSQARTDYKTARAACVK